ncbi:hypothetical protein [Sporolactobacillus sp. KGMB 08714]|uniref:hypothetical protein n=1 Tax=Sporolactobacillus sp. KGMB 08714 TaxID=3064704 RepID=UPI002FBD7859
MKQQTLEAVKPAEKMSSAAVAPRQTLLCKHFIRSSEKQPVRFFSADRLPVSEGFIF